MPYEVDGFGPQTWNIAKSLGHWDKLSWTKPLPICQNKRRRGWAARTPVHPAATFFRRFAGIIGEQ